MKRLGIRRLISIIAALFMLTSVMTACGAKEEESTTSTQQTQQTATPTAEPAKVTPPEQVEISFLHCWNGGGGAFPQDQENNIIAKTLKEKTGITLKMESITTSEVEKLNLMFASGTLPDFVNAPYWNSTGGEGKVIFKGAGEGQILAIDEYLDKYPNVKKLCTVGIAKDFYEFDLHPPEFKGKTYIIPQQTPDGTVESITNFQYGCYARGDILKALGVKAEDIDTSDELYDLLVKIKNGGFKDINGKPVIPAGTLHNGWNYQSFLSFWTDYNISSYREENSKLMLYIFSKDEEDKLLYMRKLIKDGLFDLEAFSNTDTMGKEKLSVGKLAVFGAQPMTNDLLSTLYKTNPEMKYELLGPFKNKSGNIVTQVEQKGRSGFPAMFLSAQTKKADAVLRFLDYVNSEEGLLLTYWGIEGTHYTMENGVPKWIPEVKAKFDADGTVKRDEGMWFLSNFFVGAFSSNVKWPVAEKDKSEGDKIEDVFKKKMPVVLIDKVNAGYLSRDWPKRPAYREAVAQLDYEAELRKAYFAKTDADALKLLNDMREKFKAAGAQEMADYVYEKAKKRTDIGF
ncbi:MAG: hypothetical protein ABFD25_01005 [Clostridiaceae bacterium]